MNYDYKYKKYKNKYRGLKNQLGGIVIDCKDLSTVGLNNNMGTCWNIVIQTILFYGDPFREEIQNKLQKYSAEDLIKCAKNLELFLPSNLLDENYKLLPETFELLVTLINILKKRFYIKTEDLKPDENFKRTVRILSKNSDLNNIKESDFIEEEIEYKKSHV